MRFPTFMYNIKKTAAVLADNTNNLHSIQLLTKHSILQVQLLMQGIKSNNCGE